MFSGNITTGDRSPISSSGQNGSGNFHKYSVTVVSAILSLSSCYYLCQDQAQVDMKRGVKVTKGNSNFFLSSKKSSRLQGKGEPILLTRILLDIVMCHIQSSNNVEVGQGAPSLIGRVAICMSRRRKVPHLSKTGQERQSKNAHLSTA